MGADLITAVAVWPKDTKLDFDAGREAIKNLSIEDVPDHIIESMWVGGFDENSPEELEEVKSGLLTDLNDVQSMIEQGWRNTAPYTLLGHNVLILGDMSWGDTPEGFDELTHVLDTPKVAEAVGFKLDAYQ